MVCGWLGFAEMIENSYDAIAGADYLIETATFLLSLMTFLGRFLHDLLRFTTREVGAIHIADPYVQVSSIMPQKRNPVCLEHARALSSSTIGEAQAVLMMVHNTPFGDIVDTEDDLQPHLYRGLEKSERVVRLLTAVVSTMQVDKEKWHGESSKHQLTITELADTLVRMKHISFRKAHRIAAIIARRADAANKELADVPSDWLREAAREVIGKEIALERETWVKIIQPEAFIHVRNCPGSPHPQVVAEMVKRRKLILEEHRSRYEKERTRLQEVEKKLDREVERRLSQNE
jgi:argininosuccinate lyase